MTVSSSPYYTWPDSRAWTVPSTDPKSVTVNILVGVNAAVAQAHYDGIVVTGESKRNKGEIRDHRVARDLAVGRALRLLGDELVARGYEILDSKEQ